MVGSDLEKLGFSKNEVIVYLALASLGQTRAGEVIGKTGMHRNLVYQALASLQDRNLVTKSMVGKVAAFQMTDPQRLLDLIHDQELTAQRVIDELQKTRQITAQEIQVYEGEEAIKNYWLNLARNLNGNEALHIIGSGGGLFQRIMGRTMPRYFAELGRHGGARVLMHPEQQYDASGHWYADAAGVQVRPLKTQSPPSVTIGFTDHMVCFAFYESAAPAIIQIRNSSLVGVYRTHFEILWSSNSVTYRGAEGAKAFMGELLSEKDIYWIGGNGKLETFHPEVWDWYKKEHVKRGGIRWHDLIDPGSALTGTKKGSTFYDEQWTEYKYLPSSVASPHVICIYGNKVANIVWSENSVINIIEDVEIAASHRKYFQHLWDQNAVTLTGEAGVEELLRRVLREEKDLYMIAANGVLSVRYQETFASFNRQRIKKNIAFHVLAVPSARQTPLASLKLAQVRYLSKDFESPMVVWVFGEYVATVLWNKPVTIFLIHDQMTADYYRQHFAALKVTARL